MQVVARDLEVARPIVQDPQLEGHKHRLTQGLRVPQIGQRRIVLSTLGIDNPPLDI